MTIKIREGKYYKTRDGNIVGPIRIARKIFSDDGYGWEGRSVGVNRLDCWTETGAFSTSGSKHPYDLVEEVPTPSAIVKETFKRAEEKRISKADLLDKAKGAVADRGLNYGKPEDNFARIAAFWNVYLRSAGAVDRDVFGPADVAQMMVLMKMARIHNQPDHLDSWVDIAGYAACGAEISCGT